MENDLARLVESPVERIYGPNRYDTSAQVARRVIKELGKAEYAVIANGQNFADALASAALAGKFDGPILLVEKKEYQQA